MKITCFVLCVLGLAALASAELGPKGSLKLDNEANVLRLKRQSSSSSSSSTTTSNSDGGPVEFTSHQVVQSSPGLQSRFGGDPGYTGQAVHTTGRIQDGRVIYKNIKTTKL